MFYGAASTQANALTALATVQPEAYALAKSSLVGTPATFALAFSGIGGHNILDPTRPDTSITAGPSGKVKTANATFQFSSPLTPSATFECSNDLVVWTATACSAPKVMNGLADGDYVFGVRAVLAGKRDLTPAVARWTVDTQSPHAYIISATYNPDGSLWNLKIGHHTAEADPVTYKCDIDGMAPTDCDVDSYFPSLPGGPVHTLVVHAIDSAGNDDGAANGDRIDWALGVPATTITSSGGAVDGPTLPVTFNADEANATFECSLDGAAFAACSSPRTLTGLTDGAHNFKVRAVDVSGHPDPTPAELNFTVTLPPAPPAGSTPPPAPKFTTIKPKAGAGSLKFVFTCPDGSCTATGNLTIGKKSFAIPAVKLVGSAGNFTLKFPPAALKAIAKAKKAKKKVGYSVTFTADAGSQTFAGKF
jgi:hypothetical protein